MSYTSESVLARGARLPQVEDVVALLGYRKGSDGLDVPNRVGSYFWYDDHDYRSWSGVGLNIYRTKRGPIKVTTRSTASRSYWDLTHQNKTLKLLRDLFKGHFETDAGRNRYWRPDAGPPAPITSGSYLARWRFQNGLGLAKIYLMNRKLDGPIAKNKPSGLLIFDEHNPRLLSNNFLLPYVVAVWEEYFRSTFTAALKYSTQRESALKRARLTHAHLEQVAIGTQPMERAVAESFSFQRPSTITENFRMLDPRLDLSAPLRKPYRNRRQSLYESIEGLIEHRNAFVHSGQMNMKLFDQRLNTVLTDIVAAVDRSYAYIAGHYKFKPITDY
jgi:hypothetical protein